MADSEKVVWWHVWIIVRSSDGTAELPTVTHSLLSRGFIVGPTARCMVTKHDDSPAVIVSVESGMTTWALGSASMADDLKEAEAARQKLN